MKIRVITIKDYLDYISRNKEITIEDQSISLSPINVMRLVPLTDELTDVLTTVWSFPKRGGWAVHKGDYRGNWPPQIPRALMMRYTVPGDLILDPMVGGGTTLIEAKLLGRNSIGVDINYNAIILTLHRLYYLERALEKIPKERIFSYIDSDSDSQENYLSGVKLEEMRNASYKVYNGDARNLNEIDDESIDLIATHPPYFNIIKYSGEKKEEGDLSKTRKLEIYLLWISKIAEESYRVLKPGKYCGILIGDTRIHKHYVPISHYVLQVFLDAGFILKEEVVKIQHKMKTTREVWNRIKERDFLLIYHEKLFILRKPDKDEGISKYKYSRRMDLSNFIS